jgi:hypothetical protein
MMMTMKMFQQTTPPAKLNTKTALTVKEVRFHTTADVYEHDYIPGDNPACSDGVPLTIDWTCTRTRNEPLKEKAGGKRNYVRIMSSDERMGILQNAGYSSNDIDQAIIETDRLRMKRFSTKENVQLTPGQETVQEFVEKVCRAIKNATYKKSYKQWERQYLSHWKSASSGVLENVSTENPTLTTNKVVSTGSGGAYRLSTITVETAISEN